MKQTALQVWNGSDGKMTKDFYYRLAARGPIGEIAVALFRANKTSFRAKRYHGGIPGKGSYRSMAYSSKNWSLEQLCKRLDEFASQLGIVWGWKEDHEQSVHRWIIYVELPNDFGQVSFHNSLRHQGPNYQSEWDGRRLSAERICAFCDYVLTLEKVTLT